jgi:protein-S-isoprenylcysteine O-methyltransferase Ste14
MILNPDFLPTLVLILVMCSWFAFVAVFLFRKKPKQARELKTDRDSIVGVVLQGLSYALVCSVHRPSFPLNFRLSRTLEVAFAVSIATIAFGSVWIVMSAVRVLGKEWSVTARLVEGHKLATRGPYRFMRHPIYTGMLGMLLATGLAISNWFSLLAAIVIFLIGTIIRVRSEERLLREEFGSQFEDYARRVAALLPGVY